MFFPALALVLTCSLCVPSDTPPTRRIAPPHLKAIPDARDATAFARLLNGSEPPESMRLPLLQDSSTLAAGIDVLMREKGDSTGRAPLYWVFVGEDGAVHVDSTLISSGDTSLDRRMARAVETARFQPATIAKVAVGVWMLFAPPLAFEDEPVIGKKNYTRAPRLLNADEVARALPAHLPPRLRASNNELVLWLLIDELGLVRKTRIKDRAGGSDVIHAVEQVTRLMRYEPALNGDKPVKAWGEFRISLRKASSR